MRRWSLRIALGLAAVVLVATIVYGPTAHRALNVGSGYVAKQMCSCLFVAERDFDSCRPDLPVDMDRIVAEPLPGRDGVRASFLGLVERVALHRPGMGCALQP